MIKLAYSDNLQETATDAPETTDVLGVTDVPEAIEAPAATDAVEATDVFEKTDALGDSVSEPHPVSPLEWYLLKLLEPCEDAPHEPAPAGESPESEPEQVPSFGRLKEQSLEEPEPPMAMTSLWQPMTEESAVAEESVGFAPAPAQSFKPADEEPQQESKPAKETMPSMPSWQTMEQEPEPSPAASVPAATKPKPAPRPRTLRQSPHGGRQKLMMALIPVLAITLLMLLRHPLGARPAASASSETPSPTVRPASGDVEIAWTIPPLSEFSDRDPMRLTPPPAAVAVEDAATTARPVEPPVELVVTGILFSEDHPAAIIDTQVVHEGQQVSGATVEKIDRDGVQFERNGRKWKQILKP